MTKLTSETKVVLVTGGGSGLGAALCSHFAERGFTVVVTDSNRPAAEHVASALVGQGRSAIARTLDVRSQADIETCFANLPGNRVDLLINNAGFQHVARLEEFDPAQWDALVDVVLNGTCRATRAALPVMRRQDSGRIVNIGSIHSLVASPYKSAYVAAKHGLVGFSRAIALENADVDITINTICPSYIRTPLVDAQIQSQAKAHGISQEQVIETIMLKPMPKRAFITTEEVAAAIDFLASPMARNITGQTLVIDGGWTAA